MKYIFLFLNVILLSLAGFSQVDLNLGLVAYYPFNGNANDESGNGNNATPKNGIQLTTDRLGNSNKAYLFDGIDDYLELTGNASLNPAKLSIALWFRMDGTGKMQLVGNNDNLSGYPAMYGTTLNYFSPGAHLGLRRPGTCDVNNDSGYDTTRGNFNFVPGKWYSYVATYDGAKAKIFVDGNQIAEHNTSFSSIAQCT